MKKFFVSYIENEFKNDKVDIFVDMDGVIVDYDMINYNKFKENDDVYFNKRPINYVIEILNDVSKLENVDIHILSVSRYERQIQGKKDWLEKYAPFIRKNNINIIPRDVNEFKPADILKSDFFKDLKSKDNKIILIDDSHSVLQTIFKNHENVIPFHISSILD